MTNEKRTQTVQKDRVQYFRESNPDVDQNPDIDSDLDHVPLPPDIDKRAPAKIPPDQPGLPEENQIDPPPEGDPPRNEPVRLI